MIDENYLKDILLRYKRSIITDRFVVLSKKDISRLAELKNKMEELHAIPEDFISFGIKYYSPLRIFPSVSHLLSEKFINKFRYHQSLKNRYRYELFEIEGNKVTIFRSFEIVPYRDFVSSPSKDPRVRYVMYCLQNNFKDKISENDKYYIEAKFNYLRIQLPEELK